MRKISAVILSLLMLLAFTGCSRIAEGTEMTRRGIVTDRAMSKVSNERFAESRAYITVAYEDGSADCCWAAKGSDFPEEIDIGDRVEIVCGIEEESRLLVVIDVAEIDN